MMNHLRNVPLHQRFNLIEVFYQRHDEVVAEMQQFDSEIRLWELLAGKDEIEHLQM